MWIEWYGVLCECLPSHNMRSTCNPTEMCARALANSTSTSKHTQREKERTRVHVSPLQHFTCSHLSFALFIFLLVLSCSASHMYGMCVCFRARERSRSPIRFGLVRFGSAYFCFRSLIFTAILSLCCVLSCVINGFGSGIAANKWHKHQHQQRHRHQEWIPKRNNVNRNLLSMKSVDFLHNRWLSVCWRSL